MARRLGIMYIIWDSRMIRMYDPGRGWTEYRGCQAPANAGASLDTTCHRNHVHMSLSWDGAAAITSWWTGAAQTQPYCPTMSSRATPGTGAGLVVPDLSAVPGAVPITPTAILDTRAGVGAGLGRLVPEPRRPLAVPDWRCSRVGPRRRGCSRAAGHLDEQRAGRARQLVLRRPATPRPGGRADRHDDRHDGRPAGLGRDRGAGHDAGGREPLGHCDRVRAGHGDALVPDGTYGVVTASTTLVNGQATLYVKDATPEIMDLSVDNGAGKTGSTLISITVLGVPGPLDHYHVSAHTPQVTGAGWTETVTAQDINGITVIAAVNAVDLSATGDALFYTNGGYYTVGTAVATLVAGRVTIYVKDATAETITLTASNAGISGTSTPIVVNVPPVLPTITVQPTPRTRRTTATRPSSPSPRSGRHR